MVEMGRQENLVTFPCALFETNVLDPCVCFVIIIVSDSLNFVCHRLSVGWVYKLTNRIK
jgi:hypothetical protein